MRRGRKRVSKRGWISPMLRAAKRDVQRWQAARGGRNGDQNLSKLKGGKRRF